MAIMDPGEVVCNQLVLGGWAMRLCALSFLSVSFRDLSSRFFGEIWKGFELADFDEVHVGVRC